MKDKNNTIIKDNNKLHDIIKELKKTNKNLFKYFENEERERKKIIQSNKELMMVLEPKSIEISQLINDNNIYKGTNKDLSTHCNELLKNLFAQTKIINRFNIIRIENNNNPLLVDDEMNHQNLQRFDANQNIKRNNSEIIKYNLDTVVGELTNLDNYISDLSVNNIIQEHIKSIINKSLYFINNILNDLN